MVPFVYNARSLRVRGRNSVAAVAGLALAVFLSSSILMLVRGLTKATQRAGSDDAVIALRRGADTEMASGFDESWVKALGDLPGVARDANGLPEVVGEVVVTMMLPRGDRDDVALVAVRGVEDGSLPLRPSMRLVAGRAAKPGTEEVVIGKGIWHRQRNLDLGEEIELRRGHPSKVVGVFEDGGSTYESEIWADVDSVRTAFGRPRAWVSSAHLRLTSHVGLEPFKASIATNRNLDVSVWRESELSELQTQGSSTFLLVVGEMVALFFALGAVMGAMTTMHATVSERQREIGTLRALGFSRTSILVSFLLESTLLALAGGMLGALASLGMGFFHISVVNVQTLSEIVVGFEPEPRVLLFSLLLTCAMGVAGGFLPAMQAARIPAIRALRGD